MIAHFFIPLFICLIAYLAMMVFIVQKKKDMSIANFVWGGGCLLIALYTFFMHGVYAPRHIILITMITLWAGRLITYVYLRYKGDDPRFKTWKQEGFNALFNFGYIFGLQLLLMLIMATPIVLINMSTAIPLQILDYCAILVWISGYICEALSDYQLFQFTKDPAHKGHVMQSGLWRYSRHPNYFGEIVMWWALFIFALAVPHGIYAIIAPITISFLLIFVTGIPWVEQALEKNPEYQEYKRRTSMLIPWFTKE